MMSSIKTTLLLLFLLCVTKSIQGETVESTEKLTTCNNTEAVESKENITESSTLKTDNVTTDNVDKTTEIPPEGGEEKQVSQDEKKTEEQKKRNHPLRRKRRSRVSGLKKKYTRQDESEKSNSGSSETDKDNANSDSGVTDSTVTAYMGENNINFGEGEEDIFYFFKTFLDNSCSVIKSFSNLQTTVEDILGQMDKININVQIDPETIKSYLSNFKEDWEKYCDGPKGTVEAIEFYRDLLYKTPTLFGFTTVRTDTNTDTSTEANQDLSKISDGAKKRFSPKLMLSVSEVIKSLISSKGETRAETQQLPNEVLASVVDTLEKFVERLDLPPSTKEFISSLLATLRGLGSSKRSSNFLAKLSSFINTYGDVLNSIKTAVAGPGEAKGEPSTRSQGVLSTPSKNSANKPSTDSKQTESSRRSEQLEPTLENVLKKYCELSQGSSDIITTLKAVVKEFDVSDKPDASRRTNIDFEKFFNSLKTIIGRNSDASKRAGYESVFIKEIMEKYCEGYNRSNSALTSMSKEGNSTRRSPLLPSKRLLDDYIRGSKGSVAIVDYLKHFLANYCVSPDPDNQNLRSVNKRNDLQTTVKRPVRPKVRTKSNKTDSVSSEERSEGSKHDVKIGWRQEVFEPSNRQTEKSSPRVIKKSKIRRLRKPKNLKSRIINLYNEKENGTRTRGHTGQFSKVKIMGHKEKPSTSFEVETGVERDLGSNDSNPRLRCKVRTQGSMSDVEGRTGSSKGHTFSEVPSNDTKALLCSSETSEVHRPNQNVHIKQSVSGKSIVSYDSPDKYIRNNYSPSKENLEIGTSGFSTLNDTSSKNQSISVVSTDSQNADSISRSETKFVQENGGSHRGMESSANVQGSIEAVPNKNPFITNSRQHSLGIIVENPDKNLESPLPVENNEKLQTYSKFQRTEDFDINFRRFDPERSRPEKHHRRRPR